MAMMDHSFAAPRGASFFFRMIAAISTWTREVRTEDGLHKLTDRELADIGLIRGDIPTVARALARR